MKPIAVITCALLGLAPAAQAHQLWIEQPESGNAIVRFGEYGDNLREASPGLLDKFGKPTATLISAKGEQAGAATKAADGFALPFRASKGESIVAEDADYPLYSFKKDGRELWNWYRPAARFITSFDALQPKLPLDLVPAGKPGEFVLSYRGKPLAETAVNLVTQSGWAKEGHTDAQGKVSFDLPWKGTYVAEAAHTDSTPGQRQGAKGAEKYEAVNYVTSVTFVQAEGLAPIPAGPAAPPNK